MGGQCGSSAPVECVELGSKSPVEMTVWRFLSKAESSQSAVGTAVMTGMCALPQEELSGHWNAATLTHTHTHRQVKKKKKKMHLACPTQSKISYMQTLWWWQSMELLLLLPLLQSWYSLLIPPKGLTSTSIFCIFWPGLTLTQYLNNTG